MSRLASLEERLLYDRYGKLLWLLRRQVAHAAHYMAGVALPPHERLWLEDYFSDYKENNILASRGTSKSWVHASAAAPLKALLYKNIAGLTLSNSGFRGGKELFKDAERMFLGQLKSQELPGDYLKACSVGRTIAKDPSIWTMNLRSHSRNSTAPTNNPDQLRGLRATEVLLDERAFMADEIPAKIIRPMLMVGSDFRRAAAAGDKNKITQISTIDFAVRGWWQELQVAERLQQAEYAANQARKAGDWEEHDRLMHENDGQLKTASFSYSRVDYTDLLIPELVPTLDGERMVRVHYPLEDGVERADVLRYDEQEQRALYFTYPVDKKGLEQPLRDGTVDEEIWLAEQRNIPISSSGNVFDFDLLQKIAERPIPTGKTRRKDEDGDTDDEYYAPLLYACGDPCVLGVDVARESDETAFVVIRLGQLANGEFNPFVDRVDSKGRPQLGRTDWNHVCWAESHRHMPSDEAARKIRDLHERFNLICTLSTPDAPGIGGIAMDQKGGGSAVRDDLGNPKPAVVDGQVDETFDWAATVKIFDPDDTGGYAHYATVKEQKPDEYWDGLRLTNAQNQDNVDWTFAVRAMMQQRKLYIAFFLPPSRWATDKGLVTPSGEPDRMDPEYRKWELGYTGIRRLKAQLLRLQMKVTELGTMRFVAPGDRTKEEGKKDFWASLIYAGSLARAHIKAETEADDTPPMVAPMVVYTGGQSPTHPFAGVAGMGGGGYNQW